MSKQQSAERNEAIERLREWLKPGDTVYTILRHVSRTGMMRRVSAIRFDSDAERQLHGRVSNSVRTLDSNVAQAFGDRTIPGNGEGVKIAGCGTDAGFELVYNLGRVLWPEGFGCIGEGCPSNEHANGDRDYTPNRLACTCSACPICATAAVPQCNTVCALCGECTRCGSGHLPLCRGCEADAGDEGHSHWHKDGGYSLRQRWL